MRRARLAALALAAGCTYDLTALRNDASVRDRPVPRDATAADLVAPVDAPDATVIDVPDSGPRRPPRVGTCAQANLNLNTQRTSQGLPEGAPFVTGVIDTADGVQDLTIPATSGAGCSSPELRAAPAAPPLRLFRYEVQRGPRVTATTNTGACGSSDMRIFAWTSCDGASARSMPLGCNDDDPFQLCASCTPGDISPACSVYQSSLTLSSLVPGDVIWFGVHTFQGRSTDPGTSPFRLWVGENALSPVPLPTDVSTVSSRCACQGATPPTVRAVAWPEGRDYATSTFLLAQDQTGLIGRREVPGLAGVTGVSARFTIASILRDPSEDCVDSPAAILDLLVGNLAVGWVVASAQLDANAARTPLTVSFPYTPVSRPGADGGVAPVTPSANNQYSLELRLRRSLPESKCVRLNVDLSASAQNHVILYGP